MERKIKNFSTLFTQKRFEELDTALQTSELPAEPWFTGLEQPFPLSLLAMLSVIKSGPKKSDLALHQTITKNVTASLLFTEDFEFPHFYEDWLFSLRKWVHVFGSEHDIEALVSLQIELFAQVKRGEFISPLAHVALTLFCLNFKIAHFYQSKYTMVMLSSTLPAVLQTLSPRYRCLLHYYLGRLSLMDNALRDAEKHFSTALNLRPSRRQCRKLLQMMLPLKAVLGQLPPAQVLAQPEFKVFAIVMQAMKEGHVKAIENELQTHVALLISQGTYFLVAECKLIALRNFLYKFHLLLGRPPQISFELLELAMRFQYEKELSADEILGIVSSLIYKEFIKGTINITEKILKLKSRPFPRL